MIKRLFLVPVVLVGLLAGARPVLAYGVGAHGSVSPRADLGACAEVSFGTTQPAIVGQLSVVGSRVMVNADLSADLSADLMATPETVAREARPAPAWARTMPIAVTRGDSWSGCIAGGGVSVRNGSATFTLSASGADGDVLNVTKCVVVEYRMSCTGV